MKKNILREIFSGANGKLSAKRVIGGVAMAVALGCTIALVIRDGSNSVVENLLMTIFITSVSLLGLPAVTGIWGSSKITTTDIKEETTEVPPAKTPVEASVETTKPTQQFDPVDPCKNCKYKKRDQK